MEVVSGWLCGRRGLDGGILRPRMAPLRGRSLAGVAGLSGLSVPRGATLGMSDCNSFHGVIPPLCQSDTLRPERSDANISRNVVSRDAAISARACAATVGGEKSKTRFHGEPQRKV